ncbi:MAG: hypothetical protein ACRENG_12725 [bacterium]
MPDDPVNKPNISTVIELLVDLDRRMREGFVALTQGQDNLRKDQEVMRKDQEIMRKELQALSKRMEEGFAAAAQERQALSKRIEDGLGAEARERQSLANKLDDLKKWLAEEIPATANLLYNHILDDRQKFETFRQEILKFQNEVKEKMEYIKSVLEKNEQRLLSIEEVVALLHREFVEFKKDRFIHDREVQQRLSRLEAA